MTTTLSLENLCQARPTKPGKGHLSQIDPKAILLSFFIGLSIFSAPYFRV